MNPVNDYLAPFFERAFAGLVDRGVLAIVRGGAGRRAVPLRAPARRQHPPHRVRPHPRRHRLGTPRSRSRSGGRPAAQPRIDQARDLGTRLRHARARRARALVGGRPEFQARNVASMVAHNAQLQLHGREGARPGARLEPARGLPRQAARGVHAPAGPARLLPGRRGALPRVPSALPAGAGHRAERPARRAVDDPAQRAAQRRRVRADARGLLRRAGGGQPRRGRPRGLPARGGAPSPTSTSGARCRASSSPTAPRAAATARRSSRRLGDLRYGGIGVNVWTGANFALGVASWGAYPGQHARQRRARASASSTTRCCSTTRRSRSCAGRSGCGPRPCGSPITRTWRELGRRATHFEARPTWLGLPAVALAGMKG